MSSKPATEPLTADRLALLRKELEADPGFKPLQNAMTRHLVDELAVDHDVERTIHRSMSHQLDDWAVTNQEKSGRCWLFAGLNLMRISTAQRLGLKEFEFSQNYQMFVDKLEKANFWLEAIIATADRDVDDRTVAHLLSTPAEDGGQWNMFAALVAKHGVMPKQAMPETRSSSCTAQLDRDLSLVLRQAARDLRRAEPSAVGEAKDAALATVHRMLCLHLGTPPTSFEWQWRDKDGAFHRDADLTPLEFAEKYVTLPLEEYVCLVHDPREENPRGRTYTVEHLGNVVGGPTVTYLNVEMDLLKRLAMESIVGRDGEPGEPVWFGCDTDKMSEAKPGLWDAALFDYDGIYGTTTDLTKAERLHHHATAMTHAMMLTGVDVVGGSGGPGSDAAPQPRRWRVENSWGPERGDKGFFTMNDNWFGEHVFEIAVRRSALPADLQAVLEDEPTVLPAWDPMGALAR